MLKSETLQPALWLKWALVSAVCLAGGWTIAEIPGDIEFELRWALGSPMAGKVPLRILGLIVAGVFTLLVSIGLQWLVLRRLFKSAGWWMLGTVVGLAITGLGYEFVFREVGFVVNRLTDKSVSGAIAGTAAGMIQWVALRRQSARSGWWVLVSAVGWATGEFVGAVIRSTIKSHQIAGMEGPVFWGIAVAAGMQLLLLSESTAQPGLKFLNILGWVLGSIAGAIVVFAVDLAVFMFAFIMTFEVDRAQIPGYLEWVVYLVPAGIRAVAGVGVGLIQWRALRQRGSHVGWWLSSTVLGWILGWFVWRVCGGVGLESIMSATLSGAVAGGTGGVMAGIALDWLLRHPVQDA